MALFSLFISGTVLSCPPEFDPSKILGTWEIVPNKNCITNATGTIIIKEKNHGLAEDSVTGQLCAKKGLAISSKLSSKVLTKVIDEVDSATSLIEKGETPVIFRCSTNSYGPEFFRERFTDSYFENLTFSRLFPTPLCAVNPLDGEGTKVTVSLEWKKDSLTMKYKKNVTPHDVDNENLFLECSFNRRNFR